MGYKIHNFISFFTNVHFMDKKFTCQMNSPVVKTAPKTFKVDLLYLYLKTGIERWEDRLEGKLLSSGIHSFLLGSVPTTTFTYVSRIRFYVFNGFR